MGWSRKHVLQFRLDVIAVCGAIRSEGQVLLAKVTRTRSSRMVVANAREELSVLFAQELHRNRAVCVSPGVRPRRERIEVGREALVFLRGVRSRGIVGNVHDRGSQGRASTPSMRWLAITSRRTRALEAIGVPPRVRRSSRIARNVAALCSGKSCTRSAVRQ